MSLLDELLFGMDGMEPDTGGEEERARKEREEKERRAAIEEALQKRRAIQETQQRAQFDEAIRNLPPQQTAPGQPLPITNPLEQWRPWAMGLRAAEAAPPPPSNMEKVVNQSYGFNQKPIWADQAQADQQKAASYASPMDQIFQGLQARQMPGMNFNPMQQQAPQLQNSLMKAVTDPRLKADPDNLVDNWILGSIATPDQSRFVDRNDMAAMNMMREAGGNPAQYDFNDQRRPVMSKMGFARQAIKEITRGMLEGPKYKGFEERAKEEADKQQAFLQQQAQMGQMVRKAQQQDQTLLDRFQRDRAAQQLQTLLGTERALNSQGKLGLAKDHELIQDAFTLAKYHLAMQKARGEIDDATYNQLLKQENLKRLQNNMSPEAMANADARAAYFSDPNILNKQEDPRNDPRFFRIAQSLLGQYEQLAHQQKPTLSTMSTRSRIDLAVPNADGTLTIPVERTNRLTGELELDYKNAPSIPSNIIRDKEKYRTELAAAAESARSVQMTTRNMAQLFASGKEDQSFGALSGSSWATTFKKLSGGRDLSQAILDTNIVRQVLAEVKRMNGVRSSDAEAARLMSIFPQKISDPMDAVKVQLVIDANASWSNTMRQNHVYDWVGGEADLAPFIMDEIQSQYNKFVKLKAARILRESEGRPAPTLREAGLEGENSDMGENIKRRIEAAGYVFDSWTGKIRKKRKDGEK